MLKWIVRIGLALCAIALVGMVSTYVFIDRELNRMYGAFVKVAEPDLPPPGPDAYALVDVNVLSPEGDAFVPGQAVVVDAGLIRSVMPADSVPAGLETVDGQGRYLIPGLTDSHIHLWQSENDLLVYVANGVTQVRDMNTVPVNLRWRAEIEDGRIGPDIFAVAPQFATFGPMEGAFVGWTQRKTIVRTDDQVHDAVKDFAAKGYDALKSSSYLDKAGYEAMSEATRAQGIKLVGHLPIAVGLNDLWASNQSEVAHVEEFVKALDREFGGYGPDEAEAFLEYVRERSDEVADRMIEHGISVTSTMEMVDSFQRQKLDLHTELDAAELAYENPGIAEGTVITSRGMGWMPEVNIYRWPDQWDDDRKARSRIYWQAYAEAQHILFDTFREAGVPIMAGTDANVPVRVPGFSLHEEFLALQEAGMSPAQILASATSVPSDYMGTNAGRIQAGREADLVLLRDNPLEDIAATQEIDMVVLDGRRLDRAALDGLLESVKAANDESRKVPLEQF